jgi:hypothetical protein
MLWWGLILIFSTGALLGVGIALYLRVRHHMKAGGSSEITKKD